MVRHRYILAIVLLALLPACGQVALPTNTAAQLPGAAARTVTAAAASHALIPTAAASTPASGAPTPQPIDACALITPAEAAAALGTAATTLQAHAGTGKSASCQFQSAHSTPITLAVHHYRDANGAIKALQTAIDLSKQQATFREVAGVGDAAGMLGQTLAVRQQALILTVKVTGMKDVASAIDVAKRIAQTALGRMP